ncbi:sepiapterin reductase b [Genypterus blacodes]|uniref:sepiapterin reductase b n=1 Tax=Genypterus blacodes TaxID=154954 RepID=UPI003F76778A
MSNIVSAKSKILGRCFCIITGASKGLGRALAHQVAPSLQPGSALLLVARSGALLKELKEEVQSSSLAQGLAVRCVEADLSTKAGVDETVRVVEQEAVNDLDHILLFNNAASLGDVSRSAQSFINPDEVNSYLFLNVSSALALTAGILQAFPRRAGLRWTVVNLSSSFALKASANMVLYCAGKAARDMMFRVLAEEEPSVRVLNYAPGAMDTQMLQQLRRWTGIVPRRLLSCQESAAKLVNLLLDNEFSSGVHLDYFDI